MLLSIVVCSEFNSETVESFLYDCIEFVYPTMQRRDSRTTRKYETNWEGKLGIHLDRGTRHKSTNTSTSELLLLELSKQPEQYLCPIQFFERQHIKKTWKITEICCCRLIHLKYKESFGEEAYIVYRSSKSFEDSKFFVFSVDAVKSSKCFECNITIMSGVTSGFEYK